MYIHSTEVVKSPVNKPSSKHMLEELMTVCSHLGDLVTIFDGRARMQQ